MSSQCCAKWSSNLPFNGGPFPQRLWSRAQRDCFITNENITKKDLEMRRKSEVLEYKYNSSQLTKKQQYAKIAKGINPYKIQNFSNRNIEPCDINTNTNICYSSSASNVPCNTKLCYNPNIPLVDYKVRRQYNAGNTKFPQSTTSINVIQQEYECN